MKLTQFKNKIYRYLFVGLNCEVLALHLQFFKNFIFELSTYAAWAQTGVDMLQKMRWKVLKNRTQTHELDKYIMKYIMYLITFIT